MTIFPLRVGTSIGQASCRVRLQLYTCTLRSKLEVCENTMATEPRSGSGGVPHMGEACRYVGGRG